MPEMKHSIQLKIQKQSYTVPEGHNMLILQLQEHTWVSIYIGNRVIARDLSKEKIVGFSVSPGEYTIKTDGKIEKIYSKTVLSTPSLLEKMMKETPAMLQLSSDAPDRHVVDGIGEIPAGGTSFCTITIKKVGMDGRALTGVKHKDELFLRTTGGLLMDKKGKERVRSLTLKSGKAAFRLVSEKNPKVVTVTVFGEDPFLSKSEIQIEFI